MKKKLFMLLALVCMTLTASAKDVPTYSLTKASDAEAHGTITFKVGENTVTSAQEGQTVTVTVTPATGYVVNEVSGKWYAAIAATPRRTGIDLLEDIELAPVAGQENTWTFTMARANAEISATYKKLLTNTDITVTVNDVTYSGVAQTPTVTVKDGETELVKDQDYTVSFSNNTVAALSTATENAPTVTITAVATSDKYAGETTKTFTINKAALTVKAEDKSVTYGDAAPTYTVTYDGFVNNETNAVLGGTLALACDYVKNTSGAGTYTITPSGLTSDNYDITFTNGTLTVGAKALESSMIAAIEPLIYNTQAQTPEPAVTFNGMTLAKGTDFTYSYSNNIDAGTATVTITAVAEGNYSGSASKTFTIKQANAEVWFDPSQIKKTYGDPNFIFEAYAIGDGTLTYSSDDEKIATVDEYTGEVTIVGVGEVNIEATLSAGANYDGSFNWYQLIIEPKEIEYEGGDVTQDENGYTVALTEDADNPNAQPLPSDADLYNLTYSRTLTAPGTGEGDKTIDGQAANLFTVCLPFAPKTDDAAKYYTLSGVSGETLLFDEVTTPAANTPYLVAVTGSVNFLEDCADLNVASMEIATTTKDGYTFSGTFTGLTNAQAAGKYILQKGNTWGKVTAEKQNAYIPPFRAYVEAPATAAPLLIGTIGNTTGIENIRTVDQDGTERWYDLSGRRIATPTKGVNILNGKKVVIK